LSLNLFQFFQQLPSPLKKASYGLRPILGFRSGRLAALIVTGANDRIPSVHQESSDVALKLPHTFPRIVIWSEIRAEPEADGLALIAPLHRSLKFHIGSVYSHDSALDWGVVAGGAWWLSRDESSSTSASSFASYSASSARRWNSSASLLAGSRSVIMVMLGSAKLGYDNSHEMTRFSRSSRPEVGRFDKFLRGASHW